MRAYASDTRPRTRAGDAERARLEGALAEPAGDAREAPVRTVRRTAGRGATLEVRPHTAVLRKVSWVRVHATARGRRWALDTLGLRVWKLCTDMVETMGLSDGEMERLARGSEKVEPGETFDRGVAGEGFLRLTGLRITHYDAQVAGVGGHPGRRCGSTTVPVRSSTTLGRGRRSRRARTPPAGWPPPALAPGTT